MDSQTVGGGDDVEFDNDSSDRTKDNTDNEHCELKENCNCGKIHHDTTKTSFSILREGHPRQQQQENECESTADKSVQESRPSWTLEARQTPSQQHPKQHPQPEESCNALVRRRELYRKRTVSECDEISSQHSNHSTQTNTSVAPSTAAAAAPISEAISLRSILKPSITVATTPLQPHQHLQRCFKSRQQRQHSEDLFFRRHHRRRSVSMSFDETFETPNATSTFESNEPTNGHLCRMGSVQFSTDNDKLIRYDPSESAHQSVMSGLSTNISASNTTVSSSTATKPAPNITSCVVSLHQHPSLLPDDTVVQCLDKTQDSETSATNDCQAEQNLSEREDEDGDGEENTLLTMHDDDWCGSQLSPLSPPQPPPPPAPSTFNSSTNTLTMDESTQIELGAAAPCQGAQLSSDSSNDDDGDPWFCDRCQTWFGSPDPSYPFRCRCTVVVVPGNGSIGRPTLTKSDTLTSDTASIYSQSMRKDFRYYFQHPLLRIAIALSVIFCNFLIYGEDPISHSQLECSIPLVGNVYVFIFSRTPPQLCWALLKLSLTLCALIVGSAVGKYLIHRRLLKRWLRIKLFRDDSGTWMVMCAGVILVEFLISHLYNVILHIAHPSPQKLYIDSSMNVSFAVFMRWAACGTWMGDFSTAWMIVDMMLQDNLYPSWAMKCRRFWQTSSKRRILIFWAGGVSIAATVIAIIQLEVICWDCIYPHPAAFLSTNELTRSFLASCILLQDLIIVMQDWDFPHFVTDLNIKLPGMLSSSYSFWLCGSCTRTQKRTLRAVCGKEAGSHRSCEIKISGKWFNYGIIVLVMCFDLNMWKNQIIYSPQNFNHYVDPQTHHIYAVVNSTRVPPHELNWNFRSTNIDPHTGRPLIEADILLKAEYRGISGWMKALSFIPIAVGFTSFFGLIYFYGRFPPKTDRSRGGRLLKRSRSSNWQRERNQSRRISSAYWTNILNRSGASNLMTRVSNSAFHFNPIYRFKNNLARNCDQESPPVSPKLSLTLSWSRFFLNNNNNHKKPGSEQAESGITAQDESTTNAAQSPTITIR